MFFFFQTVFMVFLASCSLLNDSCVNTLHNLLIVLSSETEYLLETVFLFVLEYWSNVRRLPL